MTSWRASPYSISKAVEHISLQEEEQGSASHSRLCWERKVGKGSLSTVSPALIASPRPSPAVAPQSNASSVFTPLLVSWPAK